ncbi:MAG TPA: hypothetical protein DCP32_03495 [Anaerolineaceae bacterium]|nr:MAG: hypothetical protein A2X24_09390 [Chloroflexi bacterium GWB2_54_36]HAL15833.1 hypothetical protein [Anaerolineaceae bacterium]HBA90474.1 hypothetical protein [Anaerolineaceae bacterium]
MEKISSAIQKELVWTQPNAFKEEYELRSDDEQLATLKFRNAWGTLATAETINGCWTFKRVGFFSTRVTVRLCQAETEIASFRNNTWSGGGTLELADGRSFRISTNFWQTRLELIGDRDELILSYTDIGGFFRRSAYMVIEPQAALLPELPWIVMLSWYLVVMMYRDSAAAASVMTAG